MGKIKTREIITQAEAARLRGVSRQRINELVAGGQLATVEGSTNVYKDDVETLQLKSVGRPVGSVKNMRHSDFKELADRVGIDEAIRTVQAAENARRALNEFNPGDKIEWTFKPRGGFGRFMTIPALVFKVAAKRLQISFFDADDKIIDAWANKKDCKVIGFGDEPVEVDACSHEADPSVGGEHCS